MDSAALSGGNDPTGSITFTLYDPNANLIDTETVTDTGDGTYVTPTGYTLPTTGAVTGTYQWDVSYSGGGGNNSVSDNNDPAEQVTVLADTGTLLTVSGNVTDADGSPAVGTGVAFAGESTTTDANGNYVIYVLPGTSGYVTFTDGVDPAAEPYYGMFTKAAAVFTDISSDVTANFTWPGSTTALVTLVDANGIPVSGVTVNSSEGNVAPGVQEAQGGTPSCTTDSSGQCTVTALVGSTPSFSAGIPALASNYPSLAAETGGVPMVSGANDVTLQFLNFSEQESDGAASGPVYVAAPAGTTITNSSVASVPDNTLPSGAISLTGALTYDVTGLVPGSTIDVTFLLPVGSDPTNIYKFQNGSWVDLTSIATFSGDVVTLQLTDGGLGDADGVANGTIVDPVVFAQATTPGAPTIGPVAGGSASALVGFTAPTTDGGSPILDYSATCKSSDGGATGSVTGSASPLEVTELTNGSSYTCTVTANNAYGPGGSSGSSSSFALLASQVISFTAPASGQVGGSATLSATGGTSGNPVVFSIDATSGAGVCKVSGADGATLHYTGVGNCVIDANEAGNATYAAAATVMGSTAVGKFQVIIFLPLANKTLAQSPVNVRATSSSGLTVSFATTTPAVCTAGGTNDSSIKLVAAGKCTVVASQTGSATYSAATPVSQSFTVSK
jgi:hypothetical protein